MSDIKQSVFSNYNTDFASADADKDGSFNSFFPSDGIHNCVVTGVSQMDAKFRERDGAETHEHDATLIKFHYTLLSDPGSEGDPRSFEGAPFVFPNGGKDSLVTEKGRTRVDIAIRRLKGHVTSILGSAATPGSGLEEIVTMTQTEEIPVEVKCDTRISKDGSGKAWSTEWITQRLAQDGM
tara:strand:+ start:1020 stop:1562 length:543 start_codon:yes stop_codon:yes gene_type:complete